VLTAATDIVESVLGESYIKELWKFPLVDNTLGRRISDISEELRDNLIDELKISRLALQIDETTDVVKHAHLIIYAAARYI
jgi:hypothetical protein